MKTVSKQLLKSPLHFLALGFGSGLFPKAPGTAGSLLAWLLALAFPIILTNIFFVALASIVGVYICHWSAEKMGEHDHPAIVWDEFCGQWLTLSYVVYVVGIPAFELSTSLYAWVAALLLFRLFDILKPWPVSWLDKSLTGGWGIMLDDIAAALLAIAVLHLGLLLI